MDRRFKSFVFAIYQFNFIVVCFSQNSPGDVCKRKNGDEGTCHLLKECPSELEDLRNKIRPVNCGFQGREPVVCCRNPTVVTTKPARLRKPGITAQFWCNEYTKLCPVYYAIFGGERVLPSEFPHMAAIGYGDENQISWSCGGTLISETFVMTAAHCMNAAGIGPARWVLLGAELLINTTSSTGRKGQIHPVVRRIRHPGYKPPSKYNDIALMEIGPAVTPKPLPRNGRYLHPACLPKKNRSYDLPRAIATGWGRVGHGEDGSPELLKVELNMLDVETCNKSFEVEIKTTNLLRRGIDTTMLCAGVLEGGKDTCQGDSGGPLQIGVRNTCMYEVWGVTSFGKICALKNSPSVYVRVSEYVPWIEDIVWPK